MLYLFGEGGVRALDRSGLPAMGGLDSDYTTAMKSGVQLAADVRAGLISASDLLEVFIRRAELLNGCVNAIVVLDLERARARAAQADAALARGELWGPAPRRPCARGHVMMAANAVRRGVSRLTTRSSLWG
eukprot:COSAG03_NODE_1737_length_3583_cov_29.278416_3_plen_131_part_00